MTEELARRRVEITFVVPPPRAQVEGAPGVSEVDIVGRVLRCVVHGSFQPFLEALRGHEVISLESTPVLPLEGDSGSRRARRGADARKEVQP